MPDLEFTLRIHVDTEEEAARIYEAIYSGYAAELVRFGVLYGFGGGIMPPPIQSAAQNISRPVQIKRDAGPSLVRVDDIAGSTPTPKEESMPEPKKKGIMGRKRMGRV